MSNTPTDAPSGPRVAATRARGGFKDKPVLWVLGLSILLAVIALGGWFFINKPALESDAVNASGNRRDAETYNQTPQAPKGD